MVDLCLVAASGQDELDIQVIPEASMGPACRMNQTSPCDDYVQDEPYCPYKCSGVLSLRNLQVLFPPEAISDLMTHTRIQ